VDFSVADSPHPNRVDFSVVDSPRPNREDYSVVDFPRLHRVDFSVVDWPHLNRADFSVVDFPRLHRRDFLEVQGSADFHLAGEENPAAHLVVVAANRYHPLVAGMVHFHFPRVDTAAAHHVAATQSSPESANTLDCQVVHCFPECSEE
jgi:hypothetical protein